jgi:hypothetical protein
LGAQLEPLAIIENIYHEKPSFRPSKWPCKLKIAKNSKLPKLSENYFGLVGKGGWPPISTWIIWLSSFLQPLTLISKILGTRKDMQRKKRNLLLPNYIVN